ncbi:MAG: TrmB family transcriptional regulator [Candidatus Thorarchaeota archaeon]|nr:TrmB family transcriptional regulator [Candidatus Thorarchaeota archaeon]
MSLTDDSRNSTIETRVIDILRDLGFGVHETAVIIALNQRSTATVSDLHGATGIHHANLYSVLDGLISRGIVIGIEGRPREYQFAPLNHLEDLLMSKISQLMEDLKRLQESRSSEGTMPSLIYTIRGHQDVSSKILSMINRAKERILLVGPSITIFGHLVRDTLDDAVKRNIKVRVILGKPSHELNPKIQQRIKEDALAINLVKDGKEALIAVPDLSICGWADNALIALQFEGFLEQMWNNTRTR